VSDDPRDHIFEIALKLVGEQGIARTSMADVAAGAGVSRATLYRYFPGGKDEVMSSMVQWEQFRFLRRLAVAIEDAPDLVSLIDRALVEAKRGVESHEQLQRVLATEPERFFPLFLHSDRLFRGIVVRFLLPRLLQEPLKPGVDPVWASDELARMFVAFLGSTGRWDIDDAATRRRLVERYFLGGILR
jgi:AcrR family transcriptional regulator